MKSNKTEVLSFDDWAKFQGLPLEKDENGLYVNRHTHYARKGWEAKPKQAEVDELQKRVKELELINFDSELHFDASKEHIDYLQKRIDETIYDLQHIESVMWEEQVEHVLMILKGDNS